MLELKIRRSRIYSILGLLVFVFALGTAIQAFLPHAVGTVLNVFRFVLIPTGIMLFAFTLAESVFFLVIATFFFSVEFALGTKFDKEALQLLLSTLLCLPFFKAGAMLGSNAAARPIWRAILISMLVFNALTLAVYANTLLGGSIAAEAFKYVGRDGQDPLFRFALGNAIELPALGTISTVAAVIALRSDSTAVALALFVNLATALISQSRGVVLIAVYPFLRMWRRFRLAVQVIIMAIVVITVVIQRATIVETLESLGGRFAGDDYNSAHERWKIFSLIFSHTNPACFAFGNGVTASRHLMGEVDLDSLGYRTVEAALLELFYEIGLCRMALLALFIWYAFCNTGFIFRLRGELLLVTIQALLLLPIISFTPLFFFAGGALCVDGRRRNATKGATPRRQENGTCSPDETVEPAKVRPHFQLSFRSP